jgi:hypothetical protein
LLFSTMSSYSPYQLEKLVVALSYQLVYRAETPSLTERIHRLETQNLIFKEFLAKLEADLPNGSQKPTNDESLTTQVAEMRRTLQRVANTAFDLKNELGNGGLDSGFVDQILLQTKGYVKDPGLRMPSNKPTGKTCLPQYTNVHTPKGWTESSSDESD